MLLVIEDDGRGFDAATVVETGTATEAATPDRSEGGLGLLGIRERATLLGGALEAGAHEGRFEVHACLPIA